jgi:putative sugar O-methyltransferase
VYTALNESIGAAELARFDELYCHPYWTKQKATFAHTLVKRLPEAFLDDSIVRPNMVRRGWAAPQLEELRYLRSRPPETREWLAGFQESRVGQPFLECEEYSCSTTSLGHLYYLVRILEAFPDLQHRTHTVVELGGGYGNFARLYRLLFPSATYVVFDFPQFVALQELYLTLNDERVEIVADPAQFAAPAAQVQLAPVQVLADAEIKADFFVSHFALSETPRNLQELVAERHFFRAERLYLTGQRTGAQPGHSWSPHEQLHALVGREFEDVTVEDFNVSWAYELVARRATSSS